MGLVGGGVVAAAAGSSGLDFGATTPAQALTSAPGNAAQNAGGQTPYGVIAAQLVSATNSSLTLYEPSLNMSPFDLPFGPKTQFCKRGCDSSWTDLAPGDRVQVGVFMGTGSELEMLWVNANPQAGWAEVDAVNGQEVRVTLEKDKSERTLVVESYTVVSSANGQETRGAASSVAPGDYIQFTGCSELPGATRVWPILIAKLAPHVPPAKANLARPS